MINATVDVRKYNSDMGKLVKRAPAAMAETLNIIAFSARKELMSTLDNYMVVRNKWSAKGMRIEKATPKHLTSAVGTTRDYLVDQVSGGTRTGERLAVPMVGSGLPRATIKSVTTPAKFPSALVDKGKGRVFEGNIKGIHGVWKTVGRMKNRQRGDGGKVFVSKGIKLLYLFDKSIVIKPRWPMHDIATKKATSRLPSAAKKAFADWTRKAGIK